MISLCDLHGFKSDGVPALRGGSRHGVLSLTEKQFDSCFQKENRFSPVECHWIYRPHSRIGLGARWRWVTQSGLHVSLFCFIFVCMFYFSTFISFCCLFWFSFFWCLFLIWESAYKRANREKIWSWVGWVCGGSGRSWRRGKYDQSIQ